MRLRPARRRDHSAHFTLPVRFQGDRCEDAASVRRGGGPATADVTPLRCAVERLLRFGCLSAVDDVAKSGPSLGLERHLTEGRLLILGTIARRTSSIRHTDFPLELDIQL